MRNVLCATLAVMPLVIAFLLAACEPSELRPVPIGIGGGGTGGSYSAPAKSAPVQTPLAPLPIEQDPGNIPGKQETHAVMNESDCYDMANQFKKMGRKLTLSRVINNSNSNLDLKYICIFEGSDAATGYFDDRRSQ